MTERVGQELLRYQDGLGREEGQDSQWEDEAGGHRGGQRMTPDSRPACSPFPWEAVGGPTNADPGRTEAAF